MLSATAHISASIPHWSDFNCNKKDISKWVSIICFNPTLVRLQPDRARPRIPARGPSTSPLESSIYKGSWSRNIAPMGRIRQEMGDRGDRGGFLALRPARPAIPGPAEARWTPKGSGASPCTPARDPRRTFAAMRTPQQPKIPSPDRSHPRPGSEVQADIGPGSLRAPPLKTTCKPMSARLRMNFSCPGPRARGGAPRRGAIDAKSGEPLTPSLPLRARVPRGSRGGASAVTPP